MRLLLQIRYRSMNMNISFLYETITTLKQLVKDMATVQERLLAVLAQVKENNGLLASNAIVIKHVFEEVKALAAAQNTPLAGLDELEAVVLEQNQAITEAVAASVDIDNLNPDVPA